VINISTKFYRMLIILSNYLTTPALIVQKHSRRPDSFGIPECCFNYCMPIIFIQYYSQRIRILSKFFYKNKILSKILIWITVLIFITFDRLLTSQYFLQIIFHKKLKIYLVPKISFFHQKFLLYKTL